MTLLKYLNSKTQLLAQKVLLKLPFQDQSKRNQHSIQTTKKVHQLKKI